MLQLSLLSSWAFLWKEDAKENHVNLCTTDCRLGKEGFLKEIWTLIKEWQLLNMLTWTSCMIKSHAVCNQCQDLLTFIYWFIYWFIYARSNVWGQDNVNLFFAWQMNRFLFFFIFNYDWSEICTCLRICVASQKWFWSSRLLFWYCLSLCLSSDCKVKSGDSVCTHENVPIHAYMYFCKTVRVIHDFTCTL